MNKQTKTSVRLVNPFTSLEFQYDTTATTLAQIESYLLIVAADLAEELHDLSPSTPQDWMSLFVAKVGPAEAGKVILGC